MNIDDSKKQRSTLKGYFKINDIPTQAQFAQLIDSLLNQRDDGLVKETDGPLCIQAEVTGNGFKKVLSLYSSFKDEYPTWVVSLLPPSGTSSQAGLSIGSHKAKNCLTIIDSGTGNEPWAVGIGVEQPKGALEVNGHVKVRALTVDSGVLNSPEKIELQVDGKPQISVTTDGVKINKNYVKVGPLIVHRSDYVPSIMNDRCQGEFVISQSTGGSDKGTTKLNSPNRLELQIGQKTKLVVLDNLDNKGDALEVDGRVKAGPITIGTWDVDSNYWAIGAPELKDKDNQKHYYALKQGLNIANKDKGKTFLNSPEEIHFRIKNDTKARLSNDGKFYVNGQLVAPNRDIAEAYASCQSLKQGDVVSLHPEQDGIVAATYANCSQVIGVISTNPAFLLGEGADGEVRQGGGLTRYPVALCGRVPCKVTDEGGPIRRGDLLASASRPGYAMRARSSGDGMYRSGTIIGKALGTLASGDGTIEIFVMLR